MTSLALAGRVEGIRSGCGPRSESGFPLPGVGRGRPSLNHPTLPRAPTSSVRARPSASEVSARQPSARSARAVSRTLCRMSPPLSEAKLASLPARRGRCLPHSRCGRCVVSFAGRGVADVRKRRSYDRSGVQSTESIRPLTPDWSRSTSTTVRVLAASRRLNPQDAPSLPPFRVLRASVGRDGALELCVLVFPEAECPLGDLWVASVRRSAR